MLPLRLNNNVNSFMALYQTGLNFTHQRDIKPRKATEIILVDTQRTPQIRNLKADLPTRIIDHHAPFTRDDLGPNVLFHSEPIGAATTLLTEQIRQQMIPIQPLEATLMMLGIYEDTGSLSYGTTTHRDILSAAWLLEQNADLDTVRRFLSPPLNDQQQALFDVLLAQAETRNIKGSNITITATKIDDYIHEISAVAGRLRDLLETSALIVAVQMPENLLVVFRTNADTLDVGRIAEHFGGGGHKRAAAVTLHDETLESVLPKLWEQVAGNLQPLATVADLMSYGVQTLDANQTVQEVIHTMRRIGHEGFPVIEGNRVIGLLTRREVDRAQEHRLDTLTVREVMSSGKVTLRPEDSVATLETQMVESGWGQIPVVDDQDHLIGIVTRTDLIKHWVRSRPTITQIAPPQISDAQIRQVLGKPVAKLIDTIASHAQDLQLRLYLVGGVVRDILLQQANFDIDFVCETNAITLAQSLQERFGGDLHSYEPFGTAKWILTEETAASLNLTLDSLPDHIDFATSRNEFYEHPTALPTVYQSSIKLDLQRRDFTINTLAVQLSPESRMGLLLDYYSGENDLRQGIIRALHSLSFVDDPTRILRAIRFEHRLGFTIEARTAELIQTAHPMLRRITGERIYNELDLLLSEQNPEKALLTLQERGILTAIHPDFRIDEHIVTLFEAARQPIPDWASAPLHMAHLYWHMLAIQLQPEATQNIIERLLIGKRFGASLLEAAEHYQALPVLMAENATPAALTQSLRGCSDTALLSLFFAFAQTPIQAVIADYAQHWQHISPTTTGETLQQLKIPAGPCYRLILQKLRDARINGIIRTDEEEYHLLQQLIQSEDTCNDDA